jgi:predicted acylesterase/phospholipase RssA
MTVVIRDLLTGKFKKPEFSLYSNPHAKAQPKRSAFVFSGAGAKILFECGALIALDAAVKDGRINSPDVLIGTSSGGLSLAYYAAGQLDVLFDLCLKLKNKDIYKINLGSILNLFNDKASIMDNSPLRNTIKNTLDFKTLRAYSKPVLVNVTNTETWEDEEIDLTKCNSDEEVLDALIKTTSVPLAFPNFKGYCDGGVVDNYPIFDAIAQQVDQIIMVITSTKEPKPIKNGKDMASQFVSIVLFNQLQSALRILELVHIKNPNIQLTELIKVMPSKPLGINLLDADGLGDINQRKGYIHQGYMDTVAALKEIK